LYDAQLTTYVTRSSNKINKTKYSRPHNISFTIYSLLKDLELYCYTSKQKILRSLHLHNVRQQCSATVFLVTRWRLSVHSCLSCFLKHFSDIYNNVPFAFTKLIQ